MEQNAFDVLRERGFVYQCTAEDEVRELLGKEKVRFYVGFDPTGNSLHVGHLLPVMAMRIMQKCGHTPIVLVGGATALVGDPSGRSTERPILTKETVANNVECLKSQLQRFISVDNAIFTNNADWFGGMLYLDFLRDIGSKFSVNRMLQAESVQMRLNSEVGVSFLEFNYMILQGYDFLHLYRTHGCRLQLGGQDQWGNITCGTELVRRLEQDSVYGLTMPLLMDKDGKKFGKSNGQAVWLDAERYSTFDYYQFWRNTDDSQVEKLMLGFTALPVDEIKRLCAPGGNINRAKEILAYEATALAHGKAEAEKVFCAAGTKFGFADEAGAIPTSSEIAKIDLAAVRRVAAADLPTFNLELPAEGINIITLLVQAGLCKTNSEARRLIQGGGAYCGDERIAGIDRVVTAADFTDGALILKAGKKNLKRVVIG